MNKSILFLSGVLCMLLVTVLLTYEELETTSCLLTAPSEYEGVKAAVYWWDRYLFISNLSPEKFQDVYGSLTIRNIPEVKQTFLTKLNTNLTRIFSEMRCGFKDKGDVFLWTDYYPMGLLDEFIVESKLETEYEGKNNLRSLSYPWKFSMRISEDKASVRRNDKWEDINIDGDFKFTNSAKSGITRYLLDAFISGFMSMEKDGAKTVTQELSEL